MCNSDASRIYRFQTANSARDAYLDSRWCFYTCGIEWTCRAWKKNMCPYTMIHNVFNTAHTRQYVVILFYPMHICLQSTSSFHFFWNFTNFLLLPPPKKTTVCSPLSIFPHHSNWRISPSASLPPSFPVFHQRQGFYRHYSFLLRPSEVPRDHNVRPLYGNKGLATGLEHHRRWKERRVFCFRWKKDRYRVFETLRLLEWRQHTMFEVSIVVSNSAQPTRSSPVTIARKVLLFRKGYRPMWEAGQRWRQGCTILEFAET